MLRPTSLIPFLVFLAGCQNLQAPKLMAPVQRCPLATPGKPSTPTSLCFLRALSGEYATYNSGANNASAFADGTVLAATGGAVIGAATNAHSDLYKAAGGIALTALGISKYGNFQTQQLATQLAVKKLICAEPYLVSLLDKNEPTSNSPASVVRFKTSPADWNPDFSTDTETAKILLAGKPTNIDSTNYVAAGQVVNAYAAAGENIKNAKLILAQVNARTLESLGNLQDSVVKQIKTDSFNLNDAIGVIKSKSPAGSGSSSDKQASTYLKAEAVIDDNEKAVSIINDYNDLARCLGTDFVPVNFD